MTAPHEPGGDDAALRQRFAEWRAHDRERLPAFTRVVAGRRHARRRGWLVPASALGVVALLAIVLRSGRQGSDPARARELAVIESSPAGAARRAELTPGELRVSTDYFLDLALATASAAAGVPSIGAVDWAPLTPAAVPLDLPFRRRN